ncbi:MAG: sigma-70 family RNA polymerase sigma factor [Ignavibacteria bacterium]|jgi:RNA polymerase sigma-70 factor (ECF subfamily)|nr:sigma-70 family RNA polymerase sigma factor [Ignavibacteria bacterium]
MSGKSNPDPDYKKLTDEELILRFQKEDIDAFNEIVFRFKDKIVNFLYRYTGSREESEDIAQDAFLRLYKSKHLYREIGKFSTWFYTIAINLAKTNLRKRKKLNAISINNVFDKGESGEKDYELPANIIAPDDSANASTESYYIQKAIDALSDKLKQVIILRDIQGLDYDEIASIAELPLGTVKSRINRGRECLKEMLEHIYKTNKE